MTGTVTVYFNTGFNGTDIPYSPTTLEYAPKKVYPDVYYMREDIDKPVIRIKDTYENLRNVDYCKIETASGTSYFFAAPSSLSQGVTALSLDLDGLLSLGGVGNINFSSGWQERGHITKSEDVLFENVASETWTPSNPLVATNLKLIESTKQESEVPVTGNLTIICTNVDLSELGEEELTQEVIQGLADGSIDPKMYFPMLHTPSTSESTIFGIYDNILYEGKYAFFKTPGTAAYDMSNEHVRWAMQKLFSCGQLQLQSSYIIPDEYYTAEHMPPDPEHPGDTGYYTRINEDGRIHRITGIEQETLESTLPFVYKGEGDYTIKNKKCLDTYRSYVIVNLGSGDMSIKSPHEIYDKSNPKVAPSVMIWADMTSTGKPYARFSYVKDNPLIWADCVKGLQWANAQISMEGASGSLWNSLNAAFNSQSIQRGIAQNVYDGTYSAKFNALSRSNAMINQSWTMQGVELARVGSLAGVGINAVKGGVAAYGAASSGAGIFTSAGLNGSQEYGNAGWGGSAGAAVQSGLAYVAADISKQNLEKLYENNYNQLILQNEQAAQNSSLQLAQLRQNANENEVDLYKNNNVIAPTLMFSPEQNLGLYGYNKFAIYEVRKSDADLKSEDMYYQRFGYSGLHRPLTSACFNAREYYSYVQAFNVNIKANAGLRIRQKAIAQLNTGVRVWKVLPDAQYYETN